MSIGLSNDLCYYLRFLREPPVESADLMTLQNGVLELGNAADVTQQIRLKDPLIVRIILQVTIEV